MVAAPGPASGPAPAQPAGAPGATPTPTALGRYALARARKDSLFRHSSASPIQAAQRDSFAGLRYFPVDLRYRLEGIMQVYGRQRRIEIPATRDTTAVVARFGRFTSSFDGIPFSLEVYRSVEADQLSVFFTDETNGVQTYGGGRYAPVQELGSGRYIIDFNDAYSPYCAYNHSYVCPLPPPRNRLRFQVLAGEMGYGPDLASQ